MFSLVSNFSVLFVQTVNDRHVDLKIGQQECEFLSCILRQDT